VLALTAAPRDGANVRFRAGCTRACIVSSAKREREREREREGGSEMKFRFSFPSAGYYSCLLAEIKFIDEKKFHPIPTSNARESLISRVQDIDSDCILCLNSIIGYVLVE